MPEMLRSYPKVRFYYLKGSWLAPGVPAVDLPGSFRDQLLIHYWEHKETLPMWICCPGPQYCRRNMAFYPYCNSCVQRFDQTEESPVINWENQGLFLVMSLAFWLT